jgi:adenylate kinase family enzyme
MVDTPQIHNGNDMVESRTLADDITRLADAIAVCDRLCLLSARTVVECAVPFDEGTNRAEGTAQDKAEVPEKGEVPQEDKRPPKCSFIPRITRDSSRLDDEEQISGSTIEESDRHPTTSAQCIAALQALLPTIRRFRLGAHESTGLTFYPIERSALKVFEPEEQHQKIRSKIIDGLHALVDAPAAFDDMEQASRYGWMGASRRTPASEPTVSPSLVSSAFKNLHPFTCAQVLRAVAPSGGVYKQVWWQSLFVILWYLHRRTGSLSGYPNTQATNAPGTAFLTSRCVDALESVLTVFERRRDRFKKLAECMDQLRHIEQRKCDLELVQLETPLLSAQIFGHGYEHEKRNLIPEIRSLIEELALDTTIPKFYSIWLNQVPSEPSYQPQEAVHLAQGFIAAATECGGLVQSVDEQSIAMPKRLQEQVAEIDRALRDRIKFLQGEPVELQELSLDRQLLPDWICSVAHWASTQRALQTTTMDRTDPEEAIRELELLARHWHRHRNACDAAGRTIKAFLSYLNKILDTFSGIEQQFPVSVNTANIDKFIATLRNTANRLSNLRQQLAKDMEIGVRWAEILMHRHIAYAESGAYSYFDPNELAHAVHVVCRSERIVSPDVILKALDVVCAAQRPDGAWHSQQPFHWGGTGSSSAPLSVETAHAVVSTVTALMRNPNQFGASRDEISQRLGGVYKALDRFFRRISGSMQSFSSPALAYQNRGEETNPTLYGWCSDRIYEPGRIDSWVTANVIAYLVGLRRLLHDRINARLRAEFLSHAPTELKPLPEIDSTDLGAGEGGTTITQLLEQLRCHRALELAEGPWLSVPPRLNPPISLWSGIFYGPPGTSKTFLAKGIAAYLEWPIISLSPADFLTRGDQHIEARAQEIFTALSRASRLVYFFDEIDELIRDRRQMTEQERSVFSFLTPSFLTKLQEFRDAAKQNEFIFILGTNYIDNIDSAAKRTGRIDRQISIVYPDLKSRGHLIMKALLGSDRSFNRLRQALSQVEELTKQLQKTPNSFLDLYVRFTALLSYTTIQELTKDLKKILEKPNQRQVYKFIDDLYDIHHMSRSARFKPEIRLADYARRFEALEEIKLVAELLPTGRFPWERSEPMPTASSSQARLAREEQLLELYSAVPTEPETATTKFRADLKQNFPNYLVS